MRNFQLMKSLSGHEKHVMKVVVGKLKKLCTVLAWIEPGKSGYL